MRADIDDLIIDWYSLREDDENEDTYTVLSPRPAYGEPAEDDEMLVKPHMWQNAPKLINMKSCNNKRDLADADACTETLSFKSSCDGLMSVDDDKTGRIASEPYVTLRKRFCGNRGNSLICQLVELANKIHNPMASPITGRDILDAEMGGLLDFSRKRNMRVKVCAQFSLAEHLRAQSNDLCLSKNLNLIDEEFSAEMAYNHIDQARAMHRYIAKRNKRKSNTYIRYDVRRKLANNRLRVKGKFLKKAKVDIADVIRQLQEQKLNF